MLLSLWIAHDSHKTYEFKQRSDCHSGSDLLGLRRLCGSWWRRWLTWTEAEAAHPPLQPQHPQPQQERQDTPMHPPGSAALRALISSASSLISSSVHTAAPPPWASDFGFAHRPSVLAKHDSPFRTWRPHLHQDDRLSFLASSSR